MTLSTNIYVLDEIGPHELFRFCQTLLTEYDEQRRPWNQQACSDTPSKVWRGGEWVTEPGSEWAICNRLGQGLPAILDITYRPGGQLRTPEEVTEHDENCTDGCDGTYHDRACWLDIDFDTAYGYKGPDGMGCGDLHAALVSKVGRWLDERGIRWEWRNEFTSEVWGGDDRHERLIDLCSSGFEATAWFRTSVEPFIGARMRDGDAS